MKKTNEEIKKMILAGMVIALAYASLVFKIKVSFLSFDVKDVILTIGAMILGPVYSVATALAVSLIEWWTISSTGAYGFIMNYLSSLTFCFIASLLFCQIKTRTNQIISLIVACVSMCAVMMMANLVVTPLYTGMEASEVVALIPKLLLPFNLTKSILNASLIFLLYPAVVRLVQRARVIPVIDFTGTSQITKRRKIISVSVAALIAVGGICVIFFVLDGTYKFIR